MKTSIIILTYNQLEYTKLCIESIRKYTEPRSYEIIIVDNASSDGTTDWLKGQQDIKVIFNESNLGFPKGCNQGIEIASGDNVLLLNNDTIVTERWLEQLTYALYSDDSVGAVSCVTNNCSYGQKISTSYQDLKQMQQFASQYNVSDPTKWDERLKLIGFCYLIKGSVLKKVGALDEMFSPGNFEDDDYSLRIRKAGYKLLLCRDTFIHHFGSVSFGRMPSKYSQILRNNARKYETKWGFSPLYSQHIRLEIVNLITEPAEAPINVLEVGCACGGTLLEIRNRYKNSNLYGIELNEATAEVAKIIADVRPENVENDIMSYEENFFDYIILADVLEHLYDPWTVLTNIRKYLKPNGKLLISLHNIMHHSVLSDLLIDGNFSYEDAGILNRTQMRFFTLNEIHRMNFRTGFTINEVSGVSKGISQKDEGFISRLDMLGEQNLKAQFETYQYILSASKNPLYDIIPIIMDNKDRPNLIIDKLKDYATTDILTMINVLFSDDSYKTELFNLIGVVHFESGEYNRALPFFERAHFTDLFNTEVLYNISYSLYFIGEESAVAEYIEELRDLDKSAYDDLLIVINELKATL
ncbi:bifunctional glycosyltransferase family 2 protein/class I SAM-dependent methyltransferase [Paenibacillus sp. P96]|uniref:Bifunctional glycosyltransferase family 2 protein/class I SAM-dependent methyltransferase n=1 Tax=Paenibacillus zeirhizosphaerae TaxID=2987519 RepID=A0ABT9FV56_9BACL|nr:bifunctional glycosyltransferase family 2 protein/class I SAM-dependent methyltransferase [Paenibacillus sp. P96]MDP4098590.1 bifunctional glycosyltransferase family 2 protein/class I SAM-dependent methyltransferase [Paenibacillus sp. P96]